MKVYIVRYTGWDDDAIIGIYHTHDKANNKVIELDKQQECGADERQGSFYLEEYEVE